MTPPPQQGNDGARRDGARRKGGGGAKAQGGPKQGGRGGGASSGGKKGGGKSGGKPGGKGGGPRSGGGRPTQDDRVAELARPLAKVLERIPATQREVLEWRMGLKDGHPHDLSSTAKQLGLSIAETKEIEQRAFEHIREVVPLKQLQRFLGGS